MHDFADRDRWLEEDRKWWWEKRRRDVVVIALAEFAGCVLAFLWWLVVT